jgi:hypothetical protein
MINYRKKMMDMNKKRYWAFKHKPGDKAREEDCIEYVERARKLNCALMQYEYGPEDDYFQGKRKVTQNWNVVKKLNEGDILFLRGGDKIYAVGEIIRPRIGHDIILNMDKIINDHDHGGYRSDEFDGCIHFDDSTVFYEDLSDGNWGQRVDVDSWRYFNSDGIYAKTIDFYMKGNVFTAITELTEKAAKEIIEKLKGDFMGKEARLLEANKNLILTGAPGTGKTFLAKELARKLLFGKKDESELSEDQKKEFNHRCGFVQFHPSYDYTDFVEGLRPTQPDENGNIGFKHTDGIFKDFCKKAQESSEKKKFVFIIDEINRGEISKIFGELFFSIDPDYRGEKDKVKTQYQNMINDKDDPFFEGFYIPKNVYIIGTMNDIDRSVESFDFAMRRRFTWVEITAAQSADNMKLSPKCKDRMTALNEVIAQIEGLGQAFQIGASYFLNKKENGEIIRDKQGEPVEPDYGELWELHLEPLLKEYLRGLDGVDEKLKSLKNAYGT